MTNLDRRDKRRAEKIALMIDAKYWIGNSGLVTVSTQLIAAALKREREEAGTSQAFHLCPCRMCSESRRFAVSGYARKANR